MKMMVRNLKYLMFLCIILIPLSCTTLKKKESAGDIEKTKPVAEKTGKTSFLTTLKPEISEGRSIIHIKATGPVQYTAFKLTDPLRLILDISEMQPKPEAQGVISFNKGAVSTISTHYFDESNITRVIVGLNQNVHYDITKTKGNELKIDIDSPGVMLAQEERQEVTTGLPVAKEEPMAETIKESEPELVKAGSMLEEPVVDAKGEKRYTGQLISLDFQNADLKNILRLIAGVSGFNIITSSEVKGSVNLRLIEVPWDQALDLILKDNLLGLEKEGNIMRISTLAKLTAEKQAEIDAQAMGVASEKSKEAGEELISKTLRINYADLADLIIILDGVKSERGDIKSDERTKTLILYDVQSKIDEMKDLIKILDERTQQVTIEARIVEANTNFTRDFGIQWGGSLSRTTSQVFPNTLNLSGDIGGDSNFIVDLPAAVGRGTGTALGLTLGSLTGATLLDIQLSAMEDSGNGKILSSPRITTANHKQASIKSGRSIPYESVSSEGTQTSFANADVSLNVTPHITPDGFINLEIVATKNQADFANTSAGGTPTILTKEAQTEVLVRNGETTVLGGLYTSTKSKSNSGVPFLGEIPVLKWFFKKELNKVDTEELLIFITPRIVEDSQEVL